MHILIATTIGLLAGTHTATWGMYKDAPHEGFTWPKYSRSIFISSLIALLLVGLGALAVTGIGDLLILFGVTYVLERAVTEFYKTFLREEDQSKYFIPMQFAVRGHVVRSRALRILIGIAVAAAGALLLWSVIALQPAERANWQLFALCGSLGGWFSAFGGAWKDAPIEGFQTFKFFRSPLLTTGYALLLSTFTDSLAFAALGGLGFAIATLETYKTFFFPSKPRGKFAGKPVHFPHMLVQRYWFVPVYAGIWGLILTGVVVVLLNGVTD